MYRILLIISFLCIWTLRSEADADCVGCHLKITPQIVKDWQLSKPARKKSTVLFVTGTVTFPKRMCRM